MRTRPYGVGKEGTTHTDVHQGKKEGEEEEIERLPVLGGGSKKAKDANARSPGSRRIGKLGVSKDEARALAVSSRRARTMIAREHGFKR